MPARPLRLAALAVLAAAACTPVERPAAPLDRFTFPTGLALAGGNLIVVSSNFDLTYEDDKGGSVISLDPAASIDRSMAVRGAIRIPSFGGEARVVRAADCPGLDGDAVLVPNRLTGELLVLDLAADGGLSCGPGCRIPLTDAGEGEPFSVDVACRAGAAPTAYVGWLRVRRGSACATTTTSASCGTLSVVPLDGSGAATPVTITVNEGGVRKLKYDPQSGLLFFLSTGGRVGWIDLSGGCTLGSEESTCGVQGFDLDESVAGAEVRSIGLSSTGSSRRLYVTAKLYDPAAAAAGVLIDVGGILAVMDLGPSATGGYQTRLVRTVSLGTNVSQLEVIPRAGRRDLLAMTVTDSGEVWFWDDELGAVTGVIGRQLPGRPLDGRPVVGAQPFGLAHEDRGAGALPVRLYVGSFGDGVVSVIDLDPADPDPLSTPPGASLVGHIGG